MILIDSNVILGALNPQDSLHQIARAAIQQIEEKNEKMVLTNFVLSECITVEQYKRGKEKAIKLSEYLLNYNQVEVLHVAEVDFLKALSLFRKQNSNLSFIDCTLLQLAIENKWSLLTFDKALEKEYLEKRK